MLLGSDDGCKVWLNGELVYEHAGARGWRPTPDRPDKPGTSPA
jgi:hypothetical protein